MILDERDTQIAYRAALAGYSIFWLFFTLGIVGLWAASSSKERQPFRFRFCPTLFSLASSFFLPPGLWPFWCSIIFRTRRRENKWPRSRTNTAACVSSTAK